MGFLLPKRSPLKPALDFGVQHLRETGLLDRIYRNGGEGVASRGVDDRRANRYVGGPFKTNKLIISNIF